MRCAWWQTDLHRPIDAQHWPARCHRCFSQPAQIDKRKLRAPWRDLRADRFGFVSQFQSSATIRQHFNRCAVFEYRSYAASGGIALEADTRGNHQDRQITTAIARQSRAATETRWDIDLQHVQP